MYYLKFISIKQSGLFGVSIPNNPLKCPFHGPLCKPITDPGFKIETNIAVISLYLLYICNVLGSSL